MVNWGELWQDHGQDVDSDSQVDDTNVKQGTCKSGGACVELGEKMA